jgi:hypothetical protein
MILPCSVINWVGRTSWTYVRFHVLMAASMKMTVFRVVAPCSLVEVYQRLRGACCLHPSSTITALMMEAASTSETSVNLYQTVQCNNQEDSHLYSWPYYHSITFDFWIRYIFFLPSHPSNIWHHELLKYKQLTEGFTKKSRNNYYELWHIVKFWWNCTASETVDRDVSSGI